MMEYEGAGPEDDWPSVELNGSALPDERLVRRLHRIVAGMVGAPGTPIPAACGDWAGTKAAYRFFDNDRVTEQGVLAGTSPRRERASRRRAARY